MSALPNFITFTGVDAWTNLGRVADLSQRYPDVMLTSHMLHLIWRAEAKALAARHAIKVPAKMPLHEIVKVLARRLTGDQIVEGVCAALRGRPINHAADLPIFDTPPRPNSDGVGETGGAGHG